MADDSVATQAGIKLRTEPPEYRRGIAYLVLSLLVPGLPKAELRKLVQLAVRYAGSPYLFA